MKIKAVLSSKFSELHVHLVVRVAASDKEHRRLSASLRVHRSHPAHLMEHDWRVKFKSVIKLGHTVGWDSPDLNLVEEAQWTVEASLYLFVTSILLARETEEGEELQLSNITRALAQNPVVKAGYNVLVNPDHPMAGPLHPVVSLAAVKTQPGSIRPATEGPKAGPT